MNGIIKKIKKGTDKKHRALWNYRKYVDTASVDPSLVLLEPQQGRSFTGNIFYILQQLLTSKEYESYKLVLVSNSANRENNLTLLKHYGFDSVNIVIIGTNEYLKALATAKYLITDTSFPPYFVKREGQIIWNTWHGTPLKAMGRQDASSMHKIGNVQRNLALADFLSFPNFFTKQHFFEDYMLNNISNATVLYSGYPRNCAFFDEASSQAIIEDQEWADKRIYAYLPTWREPYSKASRKYRNADVLSYLIQIDERLCDDEIMLVNLHPLARKNIDFGIFSHIIPFPEQYETYAVLSCASVLVTDYSSVMFDFAVTRKKIVLFDYDSDLYTSNRGLYLQLDQLPFTHVRDVASLISEVRSSDYLSYDQFCNDFCPWDSPESTSRLCKRVLLGADSEFLEEKNQPNGKENVLIYSGNLGKNGITSALFSLIDSLDLTKRNYYLTFTSSHIKDNSILKDLPKEVAYIPCVGKANFTPKEKAIQYLYQIGKANFNSFDGNLRDAYINDIKRLYGFAHFDTVIQYTGYDYKKIYSFSVFPDAKKFIFIHSDMLSESKTRDNTRMELMKYAFTTYDKVVVVSDGLIPSINEISDGAADVVSIPNLFNFKRVQSLASEEISFDPTTRSNTPLDDLREAMSGERKVIVSIGRFSPEKQHFLLLDAFEKVHEEYPDSYLVIIGGNSWRNYYQLTCEKAETLKCADSVALVLGLSNPYSILAKSDGFILSSLYEGFGLVLLEADAVGVPVVSTDIDGPRSFLQQYGGAIVENNFEGLVKGLHDLLSGSIECMNVDYGQYNDDAIDKINLLLEG